jgi:hypothetical protein
MMRWLLLSILAGLYLATVMLIPVACGSSPTQAQIDRAVRDRHLGLYCYAREDGGPQSAECRAIACDQEGALIEYGQSFEDSGVRCR